jgi:hypothetical protein
MINPGENTQLAVFQILGPKTYFSAWRIWHSAWGSKSETGMSSRHALCA